MTSLRALPCVSCVAFCVALTATGAQEANPAGKSIDAITIATYEALGGTYGGMVPWFEPGNAAAARGLRAFRFFGGPPAPLPDPGVPFGLSVPVPTSPTRG